MIPAQNDRPWQELGNYATLSYQIRMILETDVDAVNSKLKVVNDLCDQFCSRGCILLCIHLLINPLFILFNGLQIRVDYPVQLSIAHVLVHAPYCFAYAHRTSILIWGRQLRIHRQFVLSLLSSPNSSMESTYYDCNFCLGIL